MKKSLIVIMFASFLLMACGTTGAESNEDIQAELKAENGLYMLIDDTYETTMETINLDLTDGIATVTNFEDDDEYSLFMVIELEIENTGRDTRVLPIYDAEIVTNTGQEIKIGEDGMPLNLETNIEGGTSTTGDFRVKLPGETISNFEYVDIILPSLESTDGSKVSSENEIRVSFSEEVID